MHIFVYFARYPTHSLLLSRIFSLIFSIFPFIFRESFCTIDDAVARGLYCSGAQFWNSKSSMFAVFLRIAHRDSLSATLFMPLNLPLSFCYSVQYSTILSTSARYTCASEGAQASFPYEEKSPQQNKRSNLCSFIIFGYLVRMKQVHFTTTRQQKVVLYRTRRYY
jgi:hypothetical protein